ncbi:unnamed protein product [Brassicogethes aeneus]|uniref:Fibronectin type-III domain-containing protein n=1 Tax=Brassicogethes aeneus TaxID=1431903 RepID=A0A9P0B2K7_BRAAE|nr:unnamed protein product [Brassicogethes aeneus]
MFLLAAGILLLSTGLAGSMPGGPGIPENITVTFLNPTSVKVSWATSHENADKYDVTYKPTDASYRVVAVVAGNSDAVTLSGLKPDTQYQVTVAAVWAGKKYRSRPIVFRTLEHPRSSPQQDPVMASYPTEAPHQPKEPSQAQPQDNVEYPQTSSTVSYEDIVEYPQTSSVVRGVEIGIVLLVLVVWIAAIALFFNRWGKIRMLLPYQPDYKHEQLKVPGTAACAAAVASGNTCTHHSGEHICQQTDTISLILPPCPCRESNPEPMNPLQTKRYTDPKENGCCNAWDQCFRPARPPRRSRDCGCQFALLHRVDT